MKINTLDKQNLHLSPHSRVSEITRILHEDAVSGATDGISKADKYRVIWNAVFDWYTSHYTEVALVNIRSLIGVADIVRSVSLIKVPCLRKRYTSDGRIELQTPIEVAPDEDVLGWLDHYVKSTLLSQYDVDAIVQSVTRNATLLRKIQANITSFSHVHADLASFLSGIGPRLTAAARLVVADEAIQIQASLWEMQLAIEFALKGLSISKNGDYKRTHVIADLCDAVRSPAFSDFQSLLLGFPSSQIVVDSRYGAGATLSNRKALEFYNLTIEAVEMVTASHARFCGNHSLGTDWIDFGMVDEDTFDQWPVV